MGRVIINKSFNPIILGYDEDLDILCNLSYNPYIGLEELLFIKNKLDQTIAFAQSNDVKKLNEINVEKEIGKFEDCTIKTKVNQTKTMVYVMIDRHTGFYKIGNSKWPSVREKTLSSQIPLIDLLFCYESKIGHETILKRKYADKQVRGEWFSLNDQDLEDIKKYLSSEI